MLNSPESTPLTAKQWECIKDITAEALDYPEDQRFEFVANASSGDPQILREVLRLLEQEASCSAEFLSAPLWDVHSIFADVADDTHCFLPGEIVANRFQIVGFLNRGGMGEVYSASDLELQEPVALKTIRNSIASSPRVIERFKQEVRQTRKITHSCVCRVYDLFCHQPPSGPPLWFLTMQLLEGETLAQRLSSAGPMLWKQAGPLIGDMVAALAAAHDLGIVHRDLKPNNVMLVKPDAGRERAIVTDFGLALGVVDETSAGVPAADGTPAYMAPEQMEGRNVGCAADQFALGLVICEMLTGTKPKMGPGGREEWERQVRVWLRESRQHRLPSPLQRTIMRCLAYKPEARFGRVGDVAAALDRISRRRIQWAVGVGLLAAALVMAWIAVTIRSGSIRIEDALQLTPETTLSGFPSLSRDGQWVAYTSDRADPGNLDVWIQPVHNGQPRRLTSDIAEETEPSISPGGTLVAYRSERNGGGIYVVEASGRNERLLVPGGRSPAFSPDGRLVAYWAGDVDDSAPTGQMYVVPVAGGAAQRLAGDFAVARFPTWNSDGHLLLFEGCRDRAAPPGPCTEWWVMQADGRDAVNTGAMAILHTGKIEMQTPPLKAWRGDHVLFSGKHGYSNSLWDLRLPRKDRHAVAPARLVASGDGKAMFPALAGNGRIAFGRASTSLHVWQIAAQPADEKTPPVKLTDDPSLDTCPSASRDGKRVYFTRRIQDFRHIYRKDLATGQESAMVTTPEDKLWPTPNRAENRMAFEVRRNLQMSIGIVNGQSVQYLCTGCTHPMSWWGDDRSLFYATPQGELSLLNSDDGTSRKVLDGGHGAILGDADWSPANQYLLFTAKRDGARQQVFAVKFPAGAPSPEGDWITLTPDSENADRPRWSMDGKTLYYLSNHDGATCIWGRSFDAERTTSNTPFAVAHYHNQRIGPSRTALYALGIGIGGHTLFVNLGEITETIWVGLLSLPGR